MGAPFRGLRAFSRKWADRLASAIPEAFDRVVEASVENKVDFLVLAGDVFDTDKPSYAHYRHFIKGMERLKNAGIPVYIVAGNHDPYANWNGYRDALPENVRLFPSDEAEYFVHRRNGDPLALIAARGFSNQPAGGDIARGMTRRAAEESCATTAPFVVGILHTGYWMDPYKAPCTEASLLSANIDYWALGHIHRRYLQPEHDPVISYCGCAQGRDIKETGSRGCFKVTLEEGLPNKVEFIQTASVEWEQVSIDVSECMGVEDILALCVRAMFDANTLVECEEMVVRLTLTGQTPLHDMLADPVLLEEMRAELNDRYPSFFCDAMVNRTSSLLDKEGLAQAGLFPAALINAASREASVREDQLAYLQSEFSQRGISLPRGMDAKLDDLTAQAEDLVLSLLDGGGCA